MEKTGKTIADSIPLTLDDLRLLIERVKDYAIFMLDTKGNIASWNEGAERIKQYRAGEVIGRNMSIFYEPEAARQKLPQKLLDIARSDGRVEDEGWRVRKDGSRFWADVVITALRDEKGELRGFAKVTRDLTERREAEQALRELSGRLVEIQNDERRRIGRELHDTTSPLLTSLTGKLYNARQRLKGNPEMSGVIDEALAMAEATGTMVRTVSAMLHPPLLDQSGLLPTLRWYLEAYANRTGARVTSRLPDSMVRMPRDREIAMFRALQEWMGAAVGLGAKSIRVHLVASEADAELTVEALDGDWTGDTMSQLRGGRGELGVAIAAMKERMRQLGATLEAERKGDSMMLRVVMPLRAGAKPID